MRTSHGPVPLYFQIESVLRERIRSGQYDSASALPTEEALRQEFGVSRGTIRLALDALRRAGLVVSYPGRGAFLTGRTPHPRTLRFAGSIDELIAHAAEAEFRIVESGLVQATAAETAELKLTDGRQVLRISGIRTRGEQRLALVVVALPETLGVLLRLPRREEPTVPVASLVIAQLGLTIREARQIIGVAIADARVSGALGVSVGAPLLEIRRTFFSTDGTPVEFATSLYPGDRYQYETTIST